MEHPVLTGAIVLLAACVTALTLFERLRLPALLAYLLVGVIIGPHGLFWLPHTPYLHYYAEFGVVLLLFTIGLEFSLAHLWALRKTAGARLARTEVNILVAATVENDIRIIGISIKPSSRNDRGMTAPVATAVPRAVNLVRDLVA